MVVGRGRSRAAPRVCARLVAGNTMTSLRNSLVLTGVLTGAFLLGLGSSHGEATPPVDPTPYEGTQVRIVESGIGPNYQESKAVSLLPDLEAQMPASGNHAEALAELADFLIEQGMDVATQVGDPFYGWQYIADTCRWVWVCEERSTVYGGKGDSNLGQLKKSHEVAFVVSTFTTLYELE